MSRTRRTSRTPGDRSRVLASVVLALGVLVVALVGIAASRLAADEGGTSSPALGVRVGGALGLEPGPPESQVLPEKLPATASTVAVPILMYHYVDDQPPPAGPYADGLTVRTNDFVAEMDYLVENGFTTVSLADVYLAMAGQKELPARPVALTFDDGGLDNYTVAFPLLRERGLTGTFFVITSRVGKEGQMDWMQLREMAAEGMSVQSHTVSHPDLRGVEAARLEAELADSRLTIEKMIGQPSYALCYPAGAYDPTVVAAAQAAGYVLAVTTEAGLGGDPTAVFEMKRRRVPAFLPLATFAGLLH